MSMTITADAGAGAFGNGISFRVEVLTNVAATQNGAKAASATSESKAITTTATGSRVYGAALNNNTSFTVNGSTTAIDNIADATNGIRYGTCKQKSDTGTPGAETIGYSTAFTDGGIALLEILASGGTITEEVSVPAVKTVPTGSSGTSGSFSPPQGSWIVVLVSAKSTSCVVTDSRGLSWTEASKLSDDPSYIGDGYAGVWIAYVPAAAAGDPYIAAIGGMTSTTSVALPVKHDVAVGDVLIVEMSNSTGAGSSVTDSQGNTYTLNQTRTTSQNDYNWTCQVTTALTVAGGDTITPVRDASGGQSNLIVVGVPHAVVSSPVEGSSVSKTAAGTSNSASVASGTLSQANEILIAAISSASITTAPIWASPFDAGVMATEAIAGSGGLRMSAAWTRTNATTAVTATGALTSSIAWELMLTAIKVITGATGSVARHKMGLAGSGIEKESGTGSARMHKMGLAASGSNTSLVTSTGSVRMHKQSLTSSGKETESGTGSVAMHKQGLTDAGTEKFIATGSVRMHKMGLSDVGTEKFIATGSVRMHKQSLSVSGKETESGTGSVRMHKQAIHALSAGVASGTGSVARHKMGLAAYGDPASLRLDNNAEGGTNGTTVSTANSGGASGVPFDIVSIGTASTLTFDNTHPAHGLLGYKYVTGSPAANCFAGWQSPIVTGPLLKVWARKYYYMTAYSSSQIRLLRATSTGTLRAAVAIDSTGHVVLLDASGTGRGTSVGVVPLNAKYRLEAKFVGDASVGQVECRMFTTNPEGIVPDEVVTSAITLNTGGTINRVDWGNPASVASYTFWGDDPVVSTRGYPGPVPVGSVARHKMGVAATGSYVGPTLINTFNGMTNGTVLSAASSGGASGNAFDSIAAIPSGGTLAADNAHLGLDSMALKVATTTTTGSPAGQWIASLGVINKLFFRVDFLKPAAATPACRPLTFRTAGGTHVFSMLFSGNSVSASYGSGFTGLTAFATTIPSLQYVRVEGWADVAAGQIYMELYTSQKDAVPAETHLYTGLTIGATATGRIDVGNGNSATSDGPFWIDLAAVSASGPISPPSVRMHKMGLTVAGKETEAGTGSVRMHKMGLSAAGRETYGSVRMHKMGLSDAGTEKFIGTGGARMHKMGLALAGKETESGTGSPRMHKMGLLGSGRETQPGTGSIRMHKMGLADTGTERFTSTASVSMHKMGLAGSSVETFFLTGGVRASKMSLSGTGTVRLAFHLSGGVAMRKMQVLGQRQPIESSSLFIFAQV